MPATFVRDDNGVLIRVSADAAGPAEVREQDPPIEPRPPRTRTDESRVAADIRRNIRHAARELAAGGSDEPLPDPEWMGYPALYRLATVKLQTLVEQGDPKAILWVVEKGMTKGALPVTIGDVRLDSMDAVVGAGQTIAERVFTGAIGVVHARQTLLMLQDYAKLRLGVDIEQLRELLSVIEAKAEERRKNPVIEGQVVPKEQLPTWGGFQEREGAAK